VNFLSPLSHIGLVKNTDAQEIRMAQPAVQYGEKKKKPGTTGLF
jgi:hypothetical protein